MRVRFLGQGLRETGESAGSVLIACLQNPAFSSFTAFVAWAGVGGVEQLRDYIQTAKSHIVNWHVFVGIDLKGTSKEALQALLELDINTSIYHTKTTITYHPKIYVFEGEGESCVLIGSSNLTERGLFNNIEANLVVDIMQSDEQGNQFIREIKAYFEDFLNGRNANTQRLSQELIEKLLTKRIISDETERRQRYERNEEDGQQGTQDSDMDEINRLFPSIRMQRSPTRQRREPQVRTESGTAAPRIVAETPAQHTPNYTPNIWGRKGILLWEKLNLIKSDVMQEGSSATHVTGQLRFTQAGFKINGRKIDHITYFRNDVFRLMNWNVVQQSPFIEIANIRFQIRISGADMGEHSLEVRHNPSGEAKQRNFTTSLRWGSFASIIKASNLIGANLHLYAPPIGENEPFFIDIEGGQTQPARRQHGLLDF